MASYYSYCGGVGSSEASSTTETTIDSQASPISGGTDLSTINSGGLSQSDILSVLDSVFGASLGLPSSAPSPCNIMAQIEEDEAERDASLSPDQTYVTTEYTSSLELLSSLSFSYFLATFSLPISILSLPSFISPFLPFVVLSCTCINIITCVFLFLFLYRTTPQSEAYLSGVHLPHLLYAELITTQAALPSTMSAYVGLTSQVTSVNESRSSLLLNISHPSSPLSLCLSAKHVKYLKPAEPKEGDVVRVVRSRGAGTKGHLYMCPNSHQYMIESNIGPLLVSLNDLVRISPLSLSPPSLTPPLSSRPSSLAVTRTNSNTGSVTNSVSKPTPLSPLPPLPPLPSSVITAHTNQPPIYSPVDRSSTYDHTPSPSMSPLSPWGVAYSPMEQEMIPVSPSYLCPSSSVVQPSPYACTTVIRPGGIPTSHRPIYYQATPPNYYHRGQPVCQYMAVPNHMMMVPRPPPPSYQSSVPSSSSTYPSQMRAIPIYRTPHPSLMHHNNSTSSANRPPPPLVPSSNTRQAQHGETNCAKRFNLPDELRSLACGKNLVSKLTSVCSGGRPCLPVELLIEKVVNNLLSKEPPDHWYTPQTKHSK